MFQPLFPMKSSGKGLNYQPLKMTMVMMVARALLLLLPVFYKASINAGGGLAAALQSDISIFIYYFLAMLDLFSFTELYLVRKQLDYQEDHPLASTCGVEVFLLQILIFNPMSVGTMLYFAFVNRGKLQLKKRMAAMNTKQKLLALLNLLFLLAVAALFYVVLFKYIAQRPGFFQNLWR